MLHIHSTAPSFSLHRKFLSPNCYVVAKWDDGETLKIDGFHDKSVAEYWLQVEAKHWLTEHGLLRAA